MKKIFTLLFSALGVTFALAQAPTGEFAKASTAPVIDGVIDAVWSEATTYNIDRAVTPETPTVGEPGETTWKGLWTKDGVYILLQVTDNAFFPNYVNGGGNDYDYDKLELYFDVNYNLADAKGPSAANTGHYQVAPGFALDKNDGTPLTNGGCTYAFMVTGNNTIAEYFVPYTKLLDVDKVQVDKTNTIGFDVTVIDRDPGDATRNQAVWSNEGVAGTSWTNMDDCGRVTFKDADANVAVESISIAASSETITTDKGTIQLTATVAPEDATITTVLWTIETTTAAVNITAEGVLSATTNGIVTLKAVSTDGSFTESDPITITITGQKQIRYTDDTWNTKNIIKNWNFDTDLTDWGGWVDAAVTGQASPVIEEGVVAMKVGLSGDSWHYQHNQIDLGAEANVEYTLIFKSWATATAPCNVDFEDTSENGYKRYGTSTDPEANGESDWRYTVTTVPSWFTFHVTFDKMVETTVQKIQWMNSLSNETIYLDSVMLVKTEELEVITKNADQLSNSMRVYPNPVATSNVLTVELMSAVNTKVAIYNAIGQKMTEKVSTGNVARFDVSSLRRGMYFIRLEDGTTQKFVK